MTLDGLEKKLREKFPKPPRKSSKEKVNFIRFADDFIITGRSKEVLEDEVKPLVEQCMRERGLEKPPEKTLITHIENGFDFLGQHLRKYKGKLLITPSRKNIHTFLEGIRKVMKDNKQASNRKSDRSIKPENSGMGELSPTCGKQGNLLEGRPCDLLCALAMGKKETSKEAHQMDEEEILPVHRRTELGVPGRNPCARWNCSAYSTVQGQECRHPTTY